MAKASLLPTTLFFLPFAGGPGYGEGVGLSPRSPDLVRVRLTLAPALPSLALTVTRPKCDSMTLM